MNGNGFVGFVLGAAFGGLGVYFLMKRKVDALEADSAEERAYFNQRLKELKGTDTKESSDETEGKHFRRVSHISDRDDLRSRVKENGYNYSNVAMEDKPADRKEGRPLQIFEITADEFDEDTEHEKITITWYENEKILADDDEHKMSVENVGGEENLEKFNNDDVKYIRNEALGIDYEICLDNINNWIDPEAEE